MPNAENKMDTLLRVTWKDTQGSTLADATTYAKLSETIAAITVEGGEVVGVRKLEAMKLKLRGIRCD